MLGLLGGSPTGDGGGESTGALEARGRDAGLTWSHGPQGLLVMPRYCTVPRPSALASPIFSPLFLAPTCVLGVGKVGAAVSHPTKFPAPNPDRGSTPRSVHLRGSSSFLHWQDWPQPAKSKGHPFGMLRRPVTSGAPSRTGRSWDMPSHRWLSAAETMR
jgi:hypothetical protein